MPVKVSVVVPVYNPGRYLEACVDSLLGQSLPADQLELIFVDDGSTDGTADRLDALAGAHPQVVVIHEPPSGWPGRPRNVGIEAATGEYIQFVDHDDALGPEALERLYAMARHNDSDVVVGKMVGVGRKVPLGVFRKNLDSATIHDSLLISTLSPHKMVRRELLLRTGLRFPEGRRRLEDHVFVVAAYFAARRISVLADYPCYYHRSRDDAGNAAGQRIDPASYLVDMEDALDVVDRHTEPGPRRDRLYRRWLRNEMLGRLRGRHLLRQPADLQAAWAHEVSLLLARRFHVGMDETLTSVERAALWLARRDDLAALLRLAQWETEGRLDAALVTARWDQRTLLLEVRTALVGSVDDPPPTGPDDPGRPRTRVPSGLPPDLGSHSWSVAAGTGAPQVVARATASHDRRFLPGEPAGSAGQLVARLDPADGLSDGRWLLFVRQNVLDRTLRTRIVDSAPGKVPAAIVGNQLVTPVRRGDTLTVEVTSDLATASRAAARAVRPRRHRSVLRATRRTVQLRFRLPVLLPDGAPLELRLVQDLRRDDGTRTETAVPAQVRAAPSASRSTVVSATLDRRRLTDGRWELLLAAPGAMPGALPLTTRLDVRGREVSIRGWRSATPPHPRERAAALLPGGTGRRLRALRRRVATRASSERSSERVPPGQRLP